MDSYDEIPYESTPVTETDPDRLAVVGRLFGLQAADPASCRVLELGCAAGGNLIPLAWRHPRSRFVGVDLSARQVADGQRLVARLGLDNIELRQADILQLDPDIGAFDYILCHGVWSWAPEAVRERILGLCVDCLAPQGIAYISYNTLPGWRLKGMLRDMLLYHLRDVEAPRERMDRAQQFLDFILRASSDLDPLYLRQLKQQISRIREAHPSYLYHEYLEQINEPFLFSDFMARAEARGLAYLADTELHTMFPSALGDEVEAMLDGLDDGVAQEQYMDFIRNRAFRQTLLCRADALKGRELDLERFEDFAFFADLAPPPKLDLRRPKAQAFRRAAGEEVRVTHPLTKAALAELGRCYPDSVSFTALADKARAAVAAAGGGTHLDAMDHLFGELFSLFLHQRIGASCRAESFSRGGDRPALTRLAGAQAAERLGHLATPRHTTLSLDPLAQRMVELLNGSHGAEDIVAALVAAIEVDPAAFPGWETSAGKPGTLAAKVRANVERLLALFGRQGVLSPEPAGCVGR